MNRKRFYYGWVIAGVSMISVMIASASRSSMIIFFPSLLAEFGWSRTAVSLAPSLSGAVAAFSALIVGTLSDRVDLKKILPIGALVAATGLFLSRTIQYRWQLYLYFGVMTSLGTAALNILPHTIIISNWFVKKRGAAIGLVTSGYGAGTLVIIPLLQLIISRYGWRSGFLALALCTGPLLLPLILGFQKTRPEQMGLQPDGEKGPVPPADIVFQENDLPSGSSNSVRPRPTLQVLGLILVNRRFWFTLIQFALGPLSVMPVISHQAAFLHDMGFGELTTSLIVGLNGLGTFLGMLLSGYLSDRISREKSYALGTVLLIAGVLNLLLIRPGSSLLLPVAYSLLFGLGFGTRPAMDAATAADIFKGRNFGFIYGVLNLGLGVGQFFGPLLAGYIFDTTGSYTAAFIFCMAAVLVATLAICLSAPRKGREVNLCT